MSTLIDGSRDAAEAATLLAPGDLNPSPDAETKSDPPPSVADGFASVQSPGEGAAVSVPTLASLPLGARLVIRCRKDWRTASVAAFEPACVRLNVASPAGGTYRVRRPSDSPLNFDGPVPLLGEAPPTGWRARLARYEERW